ncbi:MAG TPA: beta-propeller fold lactonase family protein [Streptosporangiaceae bacterium]|nr:beta-propeller fold lactonase family protein [Streptosporangiaceae bacterium]
MKLPVRIGLASAVAVPALATIAAFAAPASAATRQATHPSGASSVVFVQTDNTSGNQVAVYDRAADGTLKLAATYGTGGLGGQLTGSVADHLASQGSLVYDAAHGLLYAVNAGSNTVSVFTASGDTLRLRQTISSGGTFPVSIAVRGSLVYVVNALNGGSVQGFRVGGDHLVAIPRSNRDLHLSTTATPQFTNTPGQVAFSRNGGQLLVTTKANGNNIDVFKVTSDGTLSASPVVNNEPNTVPFAIAYDSSGNLVIAEAGTNALATYDLHANGTLTLLDRVPTGQSATCWVATDNNHLYVSNAGSASVSGYSNAPHGKLTLLGNTSTDPGTVDAVASPHGRYLYVQTGANGIVDEFSVASGGLTEIGSVTVASSAGGEGIAAA